MPIMQLAFIPINMYVLLSSNNNKEIAIDVFGPDMVNLL